MIVADTSVFAHLFVQGEVSGDVEKALVKDPLWIVPQLWRSEFRNVLANNLRVRKLTLETAIDLVARAEGFFLDRVRDVSSVAVLSLSQRSGVSAYDCEYVALAQQFEIPLVTRDKKLAAAFPETAVALEGWLDER